MQYLVRARQVHTDTTVSGVWGLIAMSTHPMRLQSCLSPVKIIIAAYDGRERTVRSR